jgi:small nuclear ribonucleoprotein E
MKGERVQIMLYDNVNLRIEGVIVVNKIINLKGFDEYMNLVLEDSQEILMKKDIKRDLGRIVLKGDNVSLVFKV